MTEPKIPKIKIPKDFKVFANVIKTITDRLNHQDENYKSLSDKIDLLLTQKNESAIRSDPMPIPTFPLTPAGMFVMSCEFVSGMPLDFAEKQKFTQDLLNRIKPELEKFGVTKMFIVKK